MRVRGYPRAYYLSYLLRDEERWRVGARYGSLSTERHERTRNALVDVRVGSRRYDQVRDGGLNDNEKETESYEYVELPFDGGLDGVRHGLWRLTDARYREALEALLEKKSHELSYLDTTSHLAQFEERPAEIDLAWSEFPEVDLDRWSDYVRTVSRSLKRYADVKASHVEFEADHTCRAFINSEGTRRVECRPVWSVECYLWLMNETGDAVPWTIKHTVTDPADLPSRQVFQREIRETVGRLRRVAAAPTLRSFLGPALLDPVPAGLLVHEAVGHRVEGSRLLAQGEGQTFKDSLGQSILPPFLTLRDDPTLERFEGRSLVGHYRFDDEGVPAQPTTLVDGGRLVEFLATRTRVRPRGRSTGHARSNYHQRAISRMGVTILEADGGSSDRELKQRLIEEIRRQGVPFGIRIVEATSGETATDAYNFQAFLGDITLATKVYPDGREEWIRGVNFVGTPLNAVRSIVAAGRRSVVDNAFCGAESGYVPVSTISPALVVSHLELQSKADIPYARYTYPIPWRSRPAG